MGRPEERLFLEEFEAQTVKMEDKLFEKDLLQSLNLELRSVLVLPDSLFVRACLSRFAAPGRSSVKSS